MRYFLDPQNACYCVTDETGAMVAFCSFGRDGQVPSGDYSAEALDIGLGIRPNLTGQGHGLTYVEAVLDFGRRTFAPSALRVTIAAFNERALRVWQKAGFRPVQWFHNEEFDLDFVVLTREASAAGN